MSSFIWHIAMGQRDEIGQLHGLKCHGWGSTLSAGYPMGNTAAGTRYSGISNSSRAFWGSNLPTHVDLLFLTLFNDAVSPLQHRRHEQVLQTGKFLRRIGCLPLKPLHRVPNTRVGVAFYCIYSCYIQCIHCQVSLNDVCSMLNIKVKYVL